MTARHGRPRPRGDGGAARRRRVSAVRSWFERSWLGEVGVRLRALDFGNQATLLGAGLLASLLPLIILLSAFASERVDDDLALRLGLNQQAAAIVSHLFRAS